MILKVGLTGGIASGKSTISRLFERHGCVVIDADRLVSDLYRPGQPGHAAIVREYGSGILDAGGNIDRAHLSEVAFQDQASIARLNSLIHPLVIAEEARRAGAAESESPAGVIYVVEATLLLEAGGRTRYDRIVVVDLPPELQLERAIARGMREEDVLRRMSHQMPREERLRHADFILDNRGSLDDAERQVEEIMKRLRVDLASLANRR